MCHWLILFQPITYCCAHELQSCCKAGVSVHEQKADSISQKCHRETYIKQELGESPNDRNDRAIRVGTAWYAQRLPQMKIYLLTNDAENRRKGLSEQLDAMSVQVRYNVQHMECPSLLLYRCASRC